MSKKPQTDRSAQDAVAETVAEMQRMGLDSMTWMGSDWMERMSDLGSEVLSFVADRVKQDVELQHSLLHCRDAAELHRLQSEFWQKAVDQYAEETGKLIEMGAGMMAPADAGADKK